ncbi:MAG TPA: lipopolysaccharide heptosyltransferase II [Verrucomicrobiae bacterium]|nr:lipopolysaccharide heptosyltransferase II [Verrucomicrobiae bacterium]
MNSQNSQRILVRGVNWLGDAVMTTPALLRLREARPKAHITLLTHAKLQELWRDHPAVDAIEPFAENESAWSIGRRLREKKFDVGLVLPNSHRSALELWVAKIPERIGYRRPWRNFFLTRAVPQRAGAVTMHKRSTPEIEELIRQNAPQSKLPSGAHHIHQYLHLTAALGAKPEPLPPQLVVSEKAVAEFIAKFKLGPSASESPVWLGLNAGAEYGPAKRWPEERFVEAAIEIQRRAHCRWLIFGLKSDSAMVARMTDQISRGTGGQKESVAKIPRAINLAGATTLAEFCAGLKLCRVVLTNDSGPMHVAAALGKPVVVPFGSTSPELTGPGLPGDTHHRLLSGHVPCSPCFLRECPIDFRCMHGISVDAVVKAISEVFHK